MLVLCLGLFIFHENQDYALQVDSDEIHAMFLSLDYLKSLIFDYIQTTRSIPYGKLDLRSSFHFFNKIGSADVEKNFVDYVRNKAAASLHDDDDLTAAIAKYTLSSDETLWRLPRQIGDDFYKKLMHSYVFFGITQTPPHPGDTLRVEINPGNKKNRSGNILFIGINSSLFLHRDNQYYTKIISSMKDGYYFQDFNGTPYERGSNIIIMNELPFDIDKQLETKQDVVFWRP